MNEANRSFFIVMHKISKALFVGSLKKREKFLLKGVCKNPPRQASAMPR